MKHILLRQLCRMLIVCLAALPFGAYAGMVGTDQVTAAAQTGGARAKLRSYLERSEVRAQLQQLGVSPASALARVDAMTDAEVAAVAGKIDKLPAGGFSIWAGVVGLLIVELIWYYWVK